MSGSRGRGESDGPMAVRMLVGAQLRKLREQAGKSRAEAGHPIRASESKISRMELGRVGFKERDVADLLTLYGVTDARAAWWRRPDSNRGQLDYEPSALTN